MKTDRFETFFDAIIAIIITVLVLKLIQPEQATWHAVWSLNTGYLTYLLCFLVIFNIWYNDHCFFWIVDEIDNRVILAYGVLIFLISLLPYFSTWLLLNFFSLDSQVIFGLLFIVTHLVYTFTTYLICKRNPDNEILSNLDFLSLRRYVPNIIILVGIVLSCTVFVPATYISCLVSTVISWWMQGILNILNFIPEITHVKFWVFKLLISVFMSRACSPAASKSKSPVDASDNSPLKSVSLCFILYFSE